MEIQRPLHWHQGMFLQPQHFQLQDLCFQSHLAPFHNFLAPHFWGVGEIEIQKASLGIRSFNILKGSFMFPDGTFAEMHRNAVLEARTFDEAWVDGGKSLPVFVGIKKFNPSGLNVQVMDKLENFGNVTTRFISHEVPDELEDMHSGGPRAEVKRLHYTLKIFWGSEVENLGDYILIEVGQLERIGGEIVVSDRFIPPVLSISSSETLVKIIREIRDQIAFRSRRLEEHKSQRGIQTAEFGSRDMVYLLALRSLNRYIPQLFHYTDTRQVHPWEVYGILRRIVGELSSFSENVSVMGELKDGTVALPDYDHRNLWQCFSSAQSLISQLLDEITAGPDYVIKLDYDGTYYGADLKPAMFDGHNRFYLVVKTMDEPKVVSQTLTTIAKLSTREYLPILIARALPGIGVEHMPVPPQELPRRAHSMYFAVDTHSEQWSLVAKGSNIALYWDNEPEDLQVELMVVGK